MVGCCSTKRHLKNNNTTKGEWVFRFSHLLCIYLMMTLSTVLNANNVVSIDRPAEKIALAEHLYYWTGEKKPFTSLVEEIQFFALWKNVQPNKTSAFKDGQPVQFLLSIQNSGKERQEMLLVQPHSTLNSIKLLYVADSAIIERYETGNSLPFSTRPIPHRHFLFPVTIEPGQSISILIEVDGLLDDFFKDFSLWQRQAYFERTDTDLIFTSLYLGILLIFAIYNALLYAGVRESSYLLFSLFAFALLVRSLTENNLLFEFFWPGFPAMQNMTLIISIMLSSVFHTLFTMAYLSINKQKLTLFRVYIFYLACHFAAFIYQAINGWPLTSIGIWVMIALPFCLFIWFSSLWLATKGNQNAKPYLIAYTVLIVGEFFAIDSQLFVNKLPLNNQADIAQLLHIIILSFVLSMRIGKSREKVHIAYAKNKAKSDFLAKMSHEIRTPINGVLGMAQLLSETPLSRKQQHYADVINHCSKTLLNVINDILEYSKIEAGKLECEHTPFNLDSLLLNNNALFWSQIQKKHLHYRFLVDPNIPHNLIGDPARLQQIFNNLFSNAIKFTDHGTIRLDVRLINSNSNVAHIEFRIKDTGIGMTEEELSRIFIPFSQASSSTNRYYGGSGLGLSITKQLVELMGGTITVHSELRIGTGFSLTIPFEIDSAAEFERQKILPQFLGKKALVLSDDISEKDPIKTTLKNWQIDTHSFTNVEEALALMHETKEHDFDIYCFSTSLLSGLHYEEKAILQRVSDKSLIYDHEFRDSSSSPFLHGFENAHFLKAPFSLQQVQDHLCEIFGFTESTSNKSTVANRTIFRPRSDLRVLVAEDDATNRLVIRAILKKLHIEHDIVTNGLQAADKYKQSPDAYDVILMDCEMPEMNGYQATKEIRYHEQQKRLRAIPIFALTAHVLPEYEKRCYDSGMNRVIGKPIDIKSLTDAFDQFCRNPESVNSNSRSQTP